MKIAVCEDKAKEIDFLNIKIKKMGKRKKY